MFHIPNQNKLTQENCYMRANSERKNMRNWIQMQTKEGELRMFNDLMLKNSTNKRLTGKETGNVQNQGKAVRKRKQIQ